MAISREWLVQFTANKKEVHWLDTGSNMWSWPLTSPMTLILTLSGSNLKNTTMSGIVAQIDVKWKGTRSIGYWANYVTFPFDCTHNLGLDFSRSEFEIAFSQESEVWLTQNERDVSQSFMTMIVIRVDLKQNLVIDGWCISCEIAIR